MKISFSYPYNHSTEKFMYLTLIPTFDFCIDRQMEEEFELANGETIGGEVEYSLGFLWLKYSFYLNIEVKSKNNRVESPA